MSPLNRGPLMGPRIPPSAMRPPPMPRFGRVPPPPPGMARPMPPPPPINPMFGIRGRPIPPLPPRPGPMMARPGPGPVGPPMFNPRGRPLPPLPPMGLRGPIGLRGPMMRPGPRGILPPHVLPHIRPRFPPNHLNGKGKMNAKKANKLEELELKKPWMTDEIRSEIQKKNKLYAKAKKNKDAKEWEEFKDLRNKVTRMIRDAKNEYLAKNPEQAHLYENDDAIEEGNDDDDSDEFCSDSEEVLKTFCEVCDRDFPTEELLKRHIQEHQTCNIDGCTFTAHSKIVEKHISMQHYTGLYKRIKNLSTEEDIQKWKEERKRRYPTAVNVELQEAANLEKERRGEVVQKHTQKFRAPHKKENLKRNRKRKRNRPLFEIEKSEKIEISDIYRGLKPFSGTGILKEEDNINDSLTAEVEVITSVQEDKFEVSDDESEVIEQPKIAETTTTNEEESPKILSLVADYGTESDNDELPEELPSKLLKLNDDEISQLSASQIQLVKETKDFQNNLAQVATATATTDNKNRRVNERRKRSNEKSSQKNKDSKENIKNKPNKLQRHNNNDVPMSKRKVSLLNKLLARSIQHERNAIFQCITFIANNNFFD